MTPPLLPQDFAEKLHNSPYRPAAAARRHARESGGRGRVLDESAEASGLGDPGAADDEDLEARWDEVRIVLCCAVFGVSTVSVEKRSFAKTRFLGDDSEEDDCSTRRTLGQIH